MEVWTDPNYRKFNEIWSLKGPSRAQKTTYPYFEIKKKGGGGSF